MHRPVPKAPELKSFLWINPEHWERHIEIYTAPVVTGLPQKAPKKELEWHNEHCAAFRDIELQWPAEIPHGSGFEDMVSLGVSFAFYKGTLCDRQFELTLYSMVQYPLAKGSPPEFMDVMPSLGRIFKGGDCGTPWRSQMQTIIGSARPVVRFWWSDKVHVRPVSGVECMAIMGWDYSFWNDSPKYEYDDALMLNLSGNAFSGFAVLPMLICLFFAQGKFKAASEAAGPLDNLEAAGVSGDSGGAESQDSD